MIDQATSAINAAVKTVAVVGSVVAAASTIKDRFSGADTMVKPVAGLKLPLPNPLFKYATYDYVLGIAVLTDTDLNYPDKSYRIGKRLPLICKSANADPSNRVLTPYGKLDFFIENLTLNSTLGYEANNNTNVTGISFEIIEPYSMGLFTIACQQASWKAGHNNWRSAPFVLTIDFRGNQENGTMAKIPGTSRQIPFKFTEIEATVKESGTVYRCTAMPYNQLAFTTKSAVLKTDTTVSGATVQEVLQTGDKSLQAVLNKRMQQLKTDGIVAVPDEIIILFPTDYSSKASSSGNTDAGATADPKQGSSEEIYKLLGVTKTDNNLAVQAGADCNQLGLSPLGFDQARKGTPPIGKDNQIYDPNLKVNVRANNTADPSISDFKFSQESDIPNAINQVLLQSKFAVDTLGADRLSPEGWRNWWRIDPQVYMVSTDANDSSTGEKPKIIVYRVIPYKVHASTAAPPNVKAPGFDKLALEVVKEYNYIYTGKNVDVLRFDITLSNTFTTMLAADGLKRSQDVKTSADDGGTDGKDTNIAPAVNGNPVEKKPGVTPTSVSYTALNTSSDRKGGGGPDTEGTRAARVFHDAITLGQDLIRLNMEIIGDPYFIAQSGMGNYTSRITQFNN